MSRVAVVGCGRWGKNLVRTFRDLGALVAVADPSPAARAEAASIAPGARTFEDPLELLADASIDAVAVASPAATHVRLVEAALASHKDVLCEKPLALRLEDAERIVSLAARRGRVLSVGHVAEYQPGVQRVRSLVAEGALGSIRFVHAERSAFGRVRRDEDVLWSFAPHDIAVLLRLFGSLPTRISASGWSPLSQRVADVASIALDFEGGAGAMLLASWLSPAKRRSLTVVGSERTAVVDEIAGTLILYDAKAHAKHGEIVLEAGGSVTVQLPSAEPLREECSDFLRACKTRSRPLTDATSALDVVTVLDAAERSLRGGESIALPRRPALAAEAYAAR